MRIFTRIQDNDIWTVKDFQQMHTAIANKKNKKHIRVVHSEQCWLFEANMSNG